MPDLLGKSSDWLEARRREHLAEAVTYRRGPISVELDATVGRSEFELADAGGILVRSHSVDFLVSAEDLTLGLPQLEDVIVRNGVAYEVHHPGGSPAWRYSDPNRKTFRIHTKVLGEDRG